MKLYVEILNPALLFFLLYSSEIWVMFSVCVSFEERKLIVLCNIDFRPLDR